jgi:uncharacterized protein YndB with AHSA1/START domain
LSLRTIAGGHATIDSMIRPTAHIHIAAPPADVIGFIADPVNAPRWMKALEVSELMSPGPIGPGSRFREVQSAGGQRIETICEIVEFDPEHRYAWRSVGDGEVHYGGSFTATPAPDGGTDLRYEGWATATGKLAEREAAWARQAQREANAEVEAIKGEVERS